ncbi:MAG: ARPP-1 family domain-containing protein [Promethearchaeota archaeon]|jgi:hypothetical protein
MSKTETIKKFATRVLNMEGLEIGAPVFLDEVSFVPIIKHEIPQEERDYLTLSEALENDLCQITDKGTEVAHIIFQNLGDIPILIEEGEIFLGQGTQDRICVGSVIVDPRTTMNISVKCVHAPHHLSRGSSFTYGGKASRGMLDEMRTQKFFNASIGAGASTISQSSVWKKVNEEMSNEKSVSDNTKYTLGIEARKGRVKKRSKKVKFPKNTIGVVAIDNKGAIKGVEIYRSPHSFNIRKEGIFESLETNISWEPEGKGHFPNAKEKAKSMFVELSKLEENKNTMKQIEIDGLIINTEGLKGEAFTTAFYSTFCPSCGEEKQRKKMCPHCEFLEEVSEDVAYMSLF